jgi:type II secretory pathway component PulJ
MQIIYQPKPKKKMSKSIITLVLLLSAAALHAQSATNTAAQKKEEDKKAIRAMAGTFFVDFRYAETFAENADYKFHDRYQATGLEYISVDEETDTKISLLHLLIMEDSKGEKSIIKHWREDWIYENTDLYLFDQSLTWRYKKLSPAEVKGQWTQKVFSVDDSPRYEGSGTWVHTDGKHYWESDADAPLPRREYTKRSDYNVLRRKNRHVITEYGFLHEQDNTKLIRTAGYADVPLVQEKGLNMYKRVEDQSQGDAGKNWWSQRRPFWREVLSAWAEIYSRRKDIAFKEKGGDGKLAMALFKLDDESFKAGKKPEDARIEIRALIDAHFKVSEVGLSEPQKNEPK